MFLLHRQNVIALTIIFQENNNIIIPDFKFCIDPENFTTSNETESTLIGLVWHVKDANVIKVYAAIQCSLGIISVLGNCLVISYVHNATKPKHSRKRHQNNFHKYTRGSLAFADILSGVTLVIGAVLEFYSPCKPPEYAQGLDLILMIMQVPFLVNSFYHLTFMSIQRYQAIINPLEQMQTSKRKYFTFLSSTWCAAFVTSGFLVWASYGFQTCYNKQHFYLFFALHIVCIIVPYVVTLVSTLTMYFAFCKALDMHIAHLMVQERKEQNRKFVRTICYIVLGYSFSCCPYMIYILLRSNHRLHHMYQLTPFSPTRNVQGTLMLSNGIVDVVVYSALDDSFRRFVKMLWYALWRPELVAVPDSEQSNSKTTSTRSSKMVSATAVV